VRSGPAGGGVGAVIFICGSSDEDGRRMVDEAVTAAADVGNGIPTVQCVSLHKSCADDPGEQ